MVQWGLVAAIVRLRLRRVAAQRSNVVWLLVMPLVFSVLMGQLMGDWSRSGTRQFTCIVYGSGEAGPVGEAIIDGLRDHPDFTLAVRDTTATPARARGLLEQNRVSGALLFGPGFADSLASGSRPTLHFYHDSDRGSSQRVRQAVAKAFADVDVRARAATLVDPAAAAADPARAAAFDAARYDSLLADPRVSLTVRTLGRARNEGLSLTDARQHSGPAYTLMFILMFALMSAKDLVLERQNRTLDRLRLGWAAPADLVLGFFLSAFLLGMLQALALLGLNAALFGIDYGASPVTLVLTVTLFTALAAAGGLLLGSLSRTGGQADALGMVAGLGLPALGGLWWPLEVVPPFMQTVGRFLPTGQAITVFHDMIGRGWGLAEAAPMLLGLTVWFVATLAAAVVGFGRLRRA
jgi:ABC-2 type transport system permease protein